MNLKSLKSAACIAAAAALFSASTVFAQMGHRWPSEKKIVPDPVTGVPLEFLTSGPQGDSKIYQTHQQWTVDGKWLTYRSGGGQAYAVNEETGDVVQVTESGYTGMLCNMHKSMTLVNGITRAAVVAAEGRGAAAAPAGGAGDAEKRCPQRNLAGRGGGFLVATGVSTDRRHRPG